MINTVKLPTRKGNVYLKVAQGHFATNHSHINYYIDVTDQKNRLSDAREVALELASYYSVNTVIDTILCLDGTGLIGACLASELTKNGFRNLNSHGTIYVVTPEDANGQMIFRDNMRHCIEGKHVLVLLGSITTGFTIRRSAQLLKYYGGIMEGVCSIYSMVDECDGFPVKHIFDLKDLPDYQSYDYMDCPFCKEGKKIRAIVNSFGYSEL